MTGGFILYLFLYGFIKLALLVYVRVSLAHLCCKINSNWLQFL